MHVLTEGLRLRISNELPNDVVLLATVSVAKNESVFTMYTCT